MDTTGKIKKLKGFTIMEVMVTIIIMTIAFSIIFQAYRYTKQLFDMSRERDEEVIKIIRFYNMLQHDMLQCDYAKPSEFGVDFFYGDDVVYYQFFDGQVKRVKNFQTDVFNIRYQNIETTYIENSNEYLEQLKFDIATNDENVLPVLLIKKYDNAFLFKQEMRKMGI